jgi:hypothetical protein
MLSAIYYIFILRLQEELKKQSIELVNIQSRFSELQINFSELQNQIFPKDFEITKAIHDRDRLLQQVELLKEELNTQISSAKIQKLENSQSVHTLELKIMELETSAKTCTEKQLTLEVLNSFCTPTSCVIFAHRS